MKSKIYQQLNRTMSQQKQQQKNCNEQGSLNLENTENRAEMNFELRELPESLSSQKNQKKSKKNRLGSNAKERRRIKSETWNYLEIKNIFKLYEQYGSQWKIMQTQFVNRAANSIKNRFYTVIRTLLKSLFRQHPTIIQKLPHEIPSKTILKFFEGRQQFAKFKGFGKKILKAINFDLESKQLKNIVLENDPQIIALYELIFDIKCPSKENIQIRKKDTAKCLSLGHLQIQQEQEICNNKKSPKSTPIQLFKTKTELSETLGDPSQIQQLQPNPYEGVIFFMPIPSYFQGSVMYRYYKPF